MSAASTMEMPVPVGLLAELTHRCPLQCPYCSNPLKLTARESELPASVWKRVIREAAKMGVLQVGFSGGEPLLCSSIAELINVARENGLYSNLITSGLGLDSRKAKELKAAGLDTVQISFQADEAELADAIAGTRAHLKKLQAVEAACEVDLPWSANFVLHRSNIDRIANFIKLAERLRAFRIELANTQFMGGRLKTDRICFRHVTSCDERKRSSIARELVLMDSCNWSMSPVTTTRDVRRHACMAGAAAA